MGKTGWREDKVTRNPTERANGLRFVINYTTWLLAKAPNGDLF